MNGSHFPEVEGEWMTDMEEEEENIELLTWKEEEEKMF
jgi:hypothetical protein